MNEINNNQIELDKQNDPATTASPEYSTDSSTPLTPYEQEYQSYKARKKKGRKKGWLIFGYISISLLSGFVGAYLALTIFSNTSSVVLYETAKQQQPVSLSSKGTIAEVSQLTSPSVVEISIEQSVTGGFFNQTVPVGAGSGVIISEDGYIITNMHVAGGGSDLIVKLYDGTEYSAELIGGDEANDIAVIKIDKTGLSPAVYGDSDTLVVGEDVIAVGNSLGEFGGSVSEGIISGLAREVAIEGQQFTLIQTTAAVNLGNSGGGLFNMNGELIAIVTAKSGGYAIEGIGFAIPINHARELAQDIIENGTSTNKAVLGVQVIEIWDDETAYQYDVTKYGVYLYVIENGSAAEKAGLEISDYVVSVDGNVIEYIVDLTSYLATKAPGDIVEIQIIRDNKMMVVPVTLQASN